MSHLYNIFGQGMLCGLIVLVALWSHAGDLANKVQALEKELIGYGVSFREVEESNLQSPLLAKIFPGRATELKIALQIDLSPQELAAKGLNVTDRHIKIAELGRLYDPNDRPPRTKSSKEYVAYLKAKTVYEEFLPYHSLEVALKLGPLRDDFREHLQVRAPRDFPIPLLDPNSPAVNYLSRKDVLTSASGILKLHSELLKLQTAFIPGFLRKTPKGIEPEVLESLKQVAKMSLAPEAELQIIADIRDYIQGSDLNEFFSVSDVMGVNYNRSLLLRSHALMVNATVVQEFLDVTGLELSEQHGLWVFKTEDVEKVRSEMGKEEFGLRLIATQKALELSSRLDEIMGQLSHDASYKKEATDLYHAISAIAGLKP